ncbi:tyrosine-protein phosphatase [Actinomycetospora callitridis]|nr:tyrosine-protein phosphatase [Actinomycetospora callitridis]MDD7920193.1 tyrosine-protein phosphatase [Actinomycetospora callitridis]
MSFRDLGGLPAGAGRRTRRGLPFRSDTLQEASTPPCSPASRTSSPKTAA